MLDNVVKSVMRQGRPLARGRHGTRPGCSGHRPRSAARGCGRCRAGLPSPPRPAGHSPFHLFRHDLHIRRPTANDTVKIGRYIHLPAATRTPPPVIEPVRSSLVSPPPRRTPDRRGGSRSGRVVLMLAPTLPSGSCATSTRPGPTSAQSAMRPATSGTWWGIFSPCRASTPTTRRRSCAHPVHPRTARAAGHSDGPDRSAEPAAGVLPITHQDLAG